MIPAYILAFTILITSVIKVTDVFIKLDKSLNEKRNEFILKTKSLHKNQDGNITLVAVLFTMMISALLMFFALKNKVELNEARYRKDSYLCFKYLNVETENYIKDMSKINISLRVLYAAKFAPDATGAAHAAFEVAKVVRNSRHVYYIKNLLKNSYCKEVTSSLSYIKNFPYEINAALILQTNFDETTILKAHKWTVTHFKNPSGIRLKNSFCLEARMEAQSEFFPKFKIKTSEISMKGFSKLKCSSGFL